MIRSRDECLQFSVTEHSQPVKIDNIGQSLPESNTLGSNLTVELEICDQMDVLDTVLISDRYVGTTKFHFLHVRLSNLFRDNSEIKAKILHTSVVIFQVEQVLVQLRIQRLQMIDVNICTLLSKQFRQKEAGKRQLHQHVFIQSLPQHSTDEEVMWNVIFMNLFYTGIWIELLVPRESKESSVGVKSRFEDLVIELTKESASIYPGFVHARSIHQNHSHFQPHIWFIVWRKLFKCIFVNEVPPDVNVNSLSLLKIDYVALMIPFVSCHQVLKEKDTLRKGYGVGHLPQDCC